MKNDETMTLKESFAQRLKSLNLFTLCKFLVAAISVMHLILANIHASGLLKLENEICGFIMFFSVIFGLVCFFQSSRSKYNNIRDIIPMSVFLVITIISLGLLASIYSGAIKGQASLTSTIEVKQALTLTIVVLVSYVVSLIGFWVDFFLNGKKFIGVNREDD